VLRAALLAVLLGAFVIESSADEVSFTKDIVPLLKSRCVVCHMPGSAQAGLALHPKGVYANLVDVKSTQSPLSRVAPGKPDDSYLYRKLTGTQAQVGGSGERMPFGDATLSAEEIERVRRWIESGAKP
jgi:mono/diheme cytochrome c family protein